jgi:hypothetical protein
MEAWLMWKTSFRPLATKFISLFPINAPNVPVFMKNPNAPQFARLIVVFPIPIMLNLWKFCLTEKRDFICKIFGL